MRSETVIITVEGMNCEHCVEKVRGALAAVVGVQNVAVDLGAKNARVTFAAPPVTVGRLMQAVNQTGFQAMGFSRPD